MNILIACEASGTIREAFRARGHNAWSCDLLPADDGSPYHLQCDVTTVLHYPWHMMIAHPDCTYLTSSAAWAFGDGPYHQKVSPGTLVGAARREAREQALDFVRLLMSQKHIDRICIENPGRGSINTRIDAAEYGFATPGPTQLIHPHQFGHDASKLTGLWLKGLPELVPTQDIPGRLVGTDKRGRPVYRWANQTDSGQNRLTPGADRWRVRSKTYQGWADAMADQWG